MKEIAEISIAIPTLNREEVLLETVEAVQEQTPRAREILVVDQTPVHAPATARRLARWQREGTIRWIHVDRPSIPISMNEALNRARCAIVLFLDDDIVPADGLIGAHERNYEDAGVAAVAGQVLQLGEEQRPSTRRRRGKGLWRDLEFRFNDTERQDVANCMAGNLSVRREWALRVGGFDENFVGVAYRFETDFARRLTEAGGRVVFDPKASIRHLQAGKGGTRVYGNRLRSARPEHSVGDHYFALKHGRPGEVMWYILLRIVREVRARYYARYPWWIPVKLVSETRGFLWAWGLWRRGEVPGKRRGLSRRRLSSGWQR